MNPFQLIKAFFTEEIKYTQTVYLNHNDELSVQNVETASSLSGDSVCQPRYVQTLNEQHDQYKKLLFEMKEQTELEQQKTDRYRSKIEKYSKHCDYTRFSSIKFDET